MDASIGLAWFLDKPVPNLALEVWRNLQKGARAVIPALWVLEMANGFATAERRGALSRSHIDSCLAQIEALLETTITTDDAGAITLRQAFSSASAFRLTAYDAAYLETARREGLPLATLDRELAAAAKKASVALFA